MQDYGVADVERLLRIPRATLKSLVAAGFVKPGRGPRNAWRFSFQDLIVLRTAQALVAAQVPPRRITRALRQLRAELPASMPLSGVNLGAIADQVVVREGGATRLVESGQYVLGFEEPKPGSDSGFQPRSLKPAARKPESDPGFAAEGLEACIDRGLALHEAGEHDAALRVYRDAVEAHGEDPVLLFDIAVLLEDMGHPQQAAQIYEVTVRHDPGMADAHYNLALVYEQLGKPREALRHLARYRQLTGGRRG